MKCTECEGRWGTCEHIGDAQMPDTDCAFYKPKKTIPREKVGSYRGVDAKFLKKVQAETEFPVSLEVEAATK